MAFDEKPEAPKGMFRVIGKSKVGGSLSADCDNLDAAKALAENLSTIPLESSIIDDTGELICSYPIEDGTGDEAKNCKVTAVSGPALFTASNTDSTMSAKVGWKYEIGPMVEGKRNLMLLPSQHNDSEGKEASEGDCVRPVLRRTERPSAEQQQDEDSIEVGMISPECIDNVVSFLPALKSIPPGEIADWSGGYMEPDYHRTVQGLMDALNENHFVQSFDWPKWQPTAMKRYQKPSSLSRATVKTCVKLTTLHVRKDRFCGGHFGAMVESGYIAALLQRLAELRKSVVRRQNVDQD